MKNKTKSTEVLAGYREAYKDIIRSTAEIEKIGIKADRDYSNPDDVIDALIDLAEKINEIIEVLDTKK